MSYFLGPPFLNSLRSVFAEGIIIISLLRPTIKIKCKVIQTKKNMIQPYFVNNGQCSRISLCTYVQVEFTQELV